jgi:glucose/mannose-6-phosphate isomerase
VYLDDLKYIHSKDSADMLGVIEKQAGQLMYSFEANDTVDTVQFTQVTTVLYSGMGGSSVAAMLVDALGSLSRQLQIVRDYDIPAFVGHDTLFIAASYSGNTEETLSALAQAEAKGCQIAVITSGGKLHEIAEEKGYMLLLLPKTVQSRFAILYALRALLLVLEKAALISADVRNGFAQVETFLQNATVAWGPEVPTVSNPAKLLAQELMGRSIVIYSGATLAPAAYKWKTGFNESAKQVAWCNQLPECNHNEMSGWTGQPVDKPYAVIDLRSSFENERVAKRFELSGKLLSGKRPAANEVWAKGETRLEQMLWTVIFGDFVSVYLGLLNGFDPASLPLADTFKREMDA